MGWCSSQGPKNNAFNEMIYGPVETRACDWSSSTNSAAAASLFHTENRCESPVLLTGFANALGWCALERWQDPTYFRQIFEGVPDQNSGVTLNSNDYASPNNRTSNFAPGKFTQRLGDTQNRDESQTEEKCVWAHGVDRVFRRRCDESDASDCDAATKNKTLDENENQCCYMKSDMRPRLRSDVENFPDHAFFPSPSDPSGPSDQRNPEPANPKPYRNAYGRKRAPPEKERFHDVLAKVWVGQAGACTSLHFDLCHGLICQVFGAKRVTLYPPSESSHLSPYKHDEGIVRCSQLDQLLMDSGCAKQREMHPDSENAKGVRVVVNTGDALYVPPFWWHHVEAMQDNASVLLPFDLSPEEQKNAARPWVHADWGRAVREKGRM